MIVNKKLVTSFLNNAHLNNNSTLGSNIIGAGIGQPLTPNINLSSAYAFPNFDELSQYHSDKFNNVRYTRDGSSISRQVEHYFSLMHDNSNCYLFSSGMSAIMAAITCTLDEIDTVITFGIFYRKTRSILENLSKTQRIKVKNLNKYDDLKSLNINNKSKVLFIVENPSNPFLKLISLKNLKENYKNSKIILDFSLASLINHKDIKLADLAITSCTKYISGHNDFLGGLVVTNNPKFNSKIWQYRSMAGSLIDPTSCYLLLRSLRTYDMRIEKMLKNTKEVLNVISKDRNVKKIFYPGSFENKIEKKIKDETLNHSGSVISFECNSEINLCKNIENLNSIKMAPTFGSVDSLIEIPLYMSRGKKFDSKIDYGDELNNLLMSNRLIRLSIGCEPIEYIINDIKILLNS